MLRLAKSLQANRNSILSRSSTSSSSNVRLFSAMPASAQSPSNTPSQPKVSPLLQKRNKKNHDEMLKIPEFRHRIELREAIENQQLNIPSHYERDTQIDPIPKQEAKIALTAALSAFHLHIESRISNEFGEGFYTIGPCGEEALAGVGLAFQDSDPSALHYRHLSTLLARPLKSGEKSIDQILLERAKGYTISKTDPVSGGHHCCLGGAGATDILVTSTLASQVCFFLNFFFFLSFSTLFSIFC